MIATGRRRSITLRRFSKGSLVAIPTGRASCPCRRSTEHNHIGPLRVAVLEEKVPTTKVLHHLVARTLEHRRHTACREVPNSEERASPEPIRTFWSFEARAIVLLTLVKSSAPTSWRDEREAAKNGRENRENCTIWAKNGDAERGFVTARTLL
jgi:hypothetical protein